MKNENKTTARATATKTEFDRIMTLGVGIKWTLGHGSGGHGNVTRAILKHADRPDEFVNRLDAAELLHPDVIDLIREHMTDFKNGRNPELF